MQGLSNQLLVASVDSGYHTPTFTLHAVTVAAAQCIMSLSPQPTAHHEPKPTAAEAVLRIRSPK
jgi:hypothetical protein